MAERQEEHTQHVPDAPVLVSPQEEAVVSGEDVTFRWEPVEEAEEYVLEVASESSFEEVVFQKSVGRATSFTMPEALPTDGGTYFWRVMARRGDQWSPGDRIESFVSVPPEHGRETVGGQEMPERQESWGPAAELVTATSVEAAAEATGDERLFAKERRMGVAHEGVEAGQIMGLVGGVAVALVLTAVVVVTWFTSVAQETRESSMGLSGYPELQATEAEAAQQLSQYELLSEQEGTYRIPIGEAMGIIVDEEYQQKGRSYSGELPLDRPPQTPAAEAPEPETPRTEQPTGPAGQGSAVTAAGASETDSLSAPRR